MKYPYTRTKEPAVLASFEHEEGEIRLLLDRRTAEVIIEVGGEEYSRHPVPRRFSPSLVRQVVEYEAEGWEEQQRLLDEIAYDLDQLEYKLVQWPYVREGS